MEHEDDLQGVENSEVDQDTNLDNGDGDAAAKAAKAEEIARNQRIRAEKAERELKALKGNKEEEKGAEKTTPKHDYSLKDIRALADVHDEDVDEVIEFANFKGISIAEAKSNATIKTLLKNKSEERNTASAANVAQTKKGSGGNSDQKLLSDFESGIVDINDVDRLVAAQLAQRKAQAQAQGN